MEEGILKKNGIAILKGEIINKKPSYNSGFKKWLIICYIHVLFSLLNYILARK